MIRAGLVVLVVFAACGDNLEDEDTRVINPVRSAYDTWIGYQLPGVVCGNNTPYKFVTSDKSDNLAVVFEPGGACWDYDSCAGKNGIRGAANPDGVKDTHYDIASFISPFMSRVDDTSPSMNWNYVWVPYCTGDVHTGATTITYPSTDSDPDSEFHHDGHAAVQEVVKWIDGNFPHMPKLLSTGCSAGGVGSVVNYRFLRNGIRSVQKAYLINDSGPIFPSSGFSKPLHEKIRSSWNLDALTPEMPAGFTLDDMGTMNTALADEFPNHCLGTTYFRRDYNFSRYSYERFYNLDERTGRRRDPVEVEQRHGAARRRVRDARQPLLLHPVLPADQRQPLHDAVQLRRLRCRRAEHDARAVGQRLRERSSHQVVSRRSGSR